MVCGLWTHFEQAMEAKQTTAYERLRTRLKMRLVELLERSPAGRDSLPPEKAQLKVQRFVKLTTFRKRS